MRHLRRAGFLVALLLMFARAVWAQGIGTVAELEGTAEVERNGTTQPLGVGVAIHLHDEVRTGKPAHLLIVFQDQSVTALADNSHLRIDEQVFNPNQGTATTVLKLLRGKVRALVSEHYHQSSSEYRIETPTAVSGVRGTDFIMTYDPEGGFSDVVGVAGRVEVHSILNRKGGGVFVTTQELTRIETGQPPTPVRLLDQPTFLEYLEGLKFISGGRPDGLVRENAVAAGSEVPAPMQAVSAIQISEGMAAAAAAVAAVEAESAASETKTGEQAEGTSAATTAEGATASALPPATQLVANKASVDFARPPDGTTAGFHDVGVFPQPPAILDGIVTGKGDIGVRF